MSKMYKDPDLNDQQLTHGLDRNLRLKIYIFFCFTLFVYAWPFSSRAHVYNTKSKLKQIGITILKFWIHFWNLVMTAHTRDLFWYITGEKSSFPFSSYTTFIICLPCFSYALLLILSFSPSILLLSFHPSYPPSCCFPSSFLCTFCLSLVNNSSVSVCH